MPGRGGVERVVVLRSERGAEVLKGVARLRLEGLAMVRLVARKLEESGSSCGSERQGRPQVGR